MNLTTEERISGFEDKPIEITQSKQQREDNLDNNKNKKINKIEPQGPVGLLTKDVVRVVSESQKVRRRRVEQRNTQRNSDQNFSRMWQRTQMQTVTKLNGLHTG